MLADLGMCRNWDSDVKRGVSVSYSRACKWITLKHNLHLPQSTNRLKNNNKTCRFLEQRVFDHLEDLVKWWYSRARRNTFDASVFHVTVFGTPFLMWTIDKQSWELDLKMCVVVRKTSWTLMNNNHRYTMNIGNGSSWGRDYLKCMRKNWWVVAHRWTVMAGL